MTEETAQKLHQRIEELEKQVTQVLLEKENLEKDNVTLREEVEALKGCNLKDRDSKIHEILSRFFTPGQIHCILHPERHIRWSPEDVASAISLKSISSKAYRYLRNKLKYPLPDISTLRKWARQFDCDTGILHNVMALMQAKANELTEFEKVTVLSFDEVKISSEICVDRARGQILGPHKYAQVVMARGLLGKWKQPIYYEFDQSMSEIILKEIIRNVQDCGFLVVAIVSDMGGGNRSLWKQLGINPNNTSFPNPSDSNKKIFVFADVPHLLKLARNHFLDKGFVTKSGGEVDKIFVQQLLEKSVHDLKLAPKLTHHHLEVKGSGRQKVKTAAQLLSNSVSQALGYLMENNLGRGDSIATTIFCKIFNDWFDVMNSSQPDSAYGTHKEQQDQILNEMTELMETIRAKGVKNKLPFQEGIQICNKSMQDLFDYLNEVLHVRYITTIKLNQDILECFFSYIRGMGHQNNHPNPVDFKYRVRNYIMGKHSAAVFSTKTNTEDKIDETCIIHTSAGITNSDITEPRGTQLLLQKEMDLTRKLQSAVKVSSVTGSLENDMSEVELPNEDITSREGLKYIAGYVAFRFKNKYPELGTSSLELDSSSWISYLTRGGLLTPSSELLSAIRISENRFSAMHGEYVCKGINVFETLTDDIMNAIDGKVPREVIHCFVRTRTYIRVRQLNMKAKNSEDEKRKLRNKMKKIAT